jgi:MFS family permease
MACAIATILLVAQALLEKDQGKPGGLAPFRKVIAAHSFSWVGIQTTFVFLIAFLQQEMPQLSDIELGRVGSTSFLVLNAVGALLPAFVLMPVAHRIGRIKTHVICLAFMTAGYLGLYWQGSSPIQLYALMAVLGIGWAAIVSLPFAIVSQKVSQARMGLYMGLFNLSVVLPQLVVSLGVALLVSRVADKNIIFAISAASLALSTIAWSFVREDQ